jgi:hypothetical protein
MSNQVVKLVAAIRGGGQTKPAARRDLTHCMLECCRRDVVALVDNDQPITGSQHSKVVSTGKCLQGGDIDDAPSLASSASSLAGLDTKQILDPSAPLIGEGLAIDEYQG